MAASCECGNEQLIHLPTYALNKIHSEVQNFYKLLHVSAPRYHHQGVNLTKEYKASLTYWPYTALSD